MHSTRAPEIHSADNRAVYKTERDGAAAVYIHCIVRAEDDVFGDPLSTDAVSPTHPYRYASPAFAPLLIPLCVDALVVPVSVRMAPPLASVTSTKSPEAAPFYNPYPSPIEPSQPISDGTHSLHLAGLILGRHTPKEYQPDTTVVRHPIFAKATPS